MRPRHLAGLVGLAREGLQRWGRPHFLIMFGMPLVLVATHPWGVATIAVGGGALIGCQILFLHAMIVAGLIWQRRARKHEGARDFAY